MGASKEHTLLTIPVSASAPDTALIVATAPLWGMLLGSVLGLERPKLKALVGVGLGVGLLLRVGMIVYRGLGMSGSSLTLRVLPHLGAVRRRGRPLCGVAC